MTAICKIRENWTNILFSDYHGIKIGLLNECSGELMTSIPFLRTVVHDIYCVGHGFNE